jgi:TadE-like protein
MMMILTGLWQLGRIVQVQEVMMNSAREAARDASLGQDSLLTVANNLLTYLQSADPSAFGAGHGTAMIAPVVGLPANTVGYTCWDNTVNRELFTISFSDLTDPSDTDPTRMSQLDLYQVGVQVPFSSVSWSSVVPIQGASRLSTSVVWASTVDSPFQIAPYLPAQ